MKELNKMYATSLLHLYLEATPSFLNIDVHVKKAPKQINLLKVRESTIDPLSSDE